MRRIHGDVITVGLQVLGMMFLFSIAVPARAAEPGKAEVVSAMKKSTDYMMDTVSNRGGFVSMYTEDLSRQWGEVPARRSMIWVQDPGTVTAVGLGTRGTAMLQMFQSGESVRDDAVRPATPEVGDHGDAARIGLVVRVVQALGLGKCREQQANLPPQSPY